MRSTPPSYPIPRSNKYGLFGRRAVLSGLPFLLCQGQAPERTEAASREAFREAFREKVYTK